MTFHSDYKQMRLLAVCLLLVLAGCGWVGQSRFAEVKLDSSPLPMQTKGAVAGLIGGIPGESQAADRRIIHTASLDLLVSDVHGIGSSIEALTQAGGGFVESSNFSQSSTGSQSGAIAIRVPQSRLYDIRERIKRLATRVESDRSDAKDVTREFVDSEAQLRNYRAEEGQYLQIMRRSGTIKDTIEVAEKLSEVRGEIEQLQGELNFMSHQVEMAAISVSLHTEPSAPSGAFHWRPMYQARLALNEMRQGLADYADGMLAFLLYLPVIVLWSGTLALGLAGGWWLLQRIRRRFFPAPKAAEA